MTYKRFVKMIEENSFAFYQFVIITAAIIVIILFYLYFKKRNKNIPIRSSYYAIYSKDTLNNPDAYPLNQTISKELYQPISLWIGRLILTQKNQIRKQASVLFEILQASPDFQNLVGKIVNLSWRQDPQVQIYEKLATKDISFTQATEQSKQAGNIHPERLNNLNGVGPLQSLAGARLNDDIIVSLKDPVGGGITEKTNDSLPSQQDQPSILITEEPVQVTGRFYGLITILQPLKEEGDEFEVIHFNKVSRKFDGPKEIIRIPQVAADLHNIARSTNHKIEKSCFNLAGWYVYGAQDTKGVFTVQAIEPRALMRLEPDDVLLGDEAGLNYIWQKNWEETESQKGTGKTVLIDPVSSCRQDAISSWQEGDRAIVIHLYGGIGGDKKDERGFLGLVTGHFAYGVASVVRDPFTDDLRFDIEYQQVYAHNSDGIISGPIKWFSYMGDLQRGWLGNRPVSDVVIKFAPVTQDYQFGEIKLSPLTELLWQLRIMMARYRVGDGTGAAIVTPARSCVQDANQALYIAIQRVEEIVNSEGDIKAWLESHPNHPQTLRFHQLIAFGRELENLLTPLGVVRYDWKNNAEILGAPSHGGGQLRTLLRTLFSWRTMLPRRAHDEIASLFLNQGAKLWFIRTNQVGGYDPDITPLAPTTLLKVSRRYA